MRRPLARGVACAALFALSSAAARGEETPRPGVSYEAARAEAVRLVKEKRLPEAAAVLEKAVEDYPDHLLANTWNLAWVRVKLGEPEKAAGALELGLSRGVWYGKFAFFDEAWAPLKALPRFAAIERTCEERRAAAQKLVRPRLDVLVPPGAAPGKKLPLFIALHGGGENVDAFRPHWTSPLLGTDFVVAFPQSTQLVAPDGYDWMQDVPTTLAELKAVHAKLLADYPVDPARVFVGGFSSGGAATLEVVAAGTFPVAGFVALCPPRAAGLTPEAARAAAARGTRGSLLTTERDRRVAAQREMAAVMKEAGLLLDFSIAPDLGHWYPPDLPERIDAVLRARLAPVPAPPAGDPAPR